jgi:hypothetical protein
MRSTGQYVGDLSTDAGSTDQSLQAAGTTCALGDRSTYYDVVRVPVLVGGQSASGDEGPRRRVAGLTLSANLRSHLPDVDEVPGEWACIPPRESPVAIVRVPTMLGVPMAVTLGAVATFMRLGATHGHRHAPDHGEQTRRDEEPGRPATNSAYLSDHLTLTLVLTPDTGYRGSRISAASGKLDQRRARQARRARCITVA